MIGKDQNSRLSLISDHNSYANTDHLYDPLRNALQRSTFSPNQNIKGRYSSASKVVKNMRSLSPAEAEAIKRSTFIPMHKRLIPTNHLQKIKGKQFTAINIEQKFGKALSPTEVSRMPKQAIEEILYEIEGEQNQAPSDIYKGRQTMLTMLPPKAIQQSPSVNMNAMFQSSHQRNSFGIEDYSHNAWKSYQSKQLLTQPSTVNFGKNETVNSRMRQGDLGNGNMGQKSYNFKQIDGQRKLGKVRMQNYKYNMFSVADELSNNGCFNYEVIASKIDNPWK